MEKHHNFRRPGSPLQPAAITYRENPDDKALAAYSDGSSLGNPGPGGWAVIIVSPEGKTRLCRGTIQNTTSGRAELLAAINALLELPRGTPATLRTDSQYVSEAVNTHRRQWEASGWRNGKGLPIANNDLFAALFALVDARPGVVVEWVQGHAHDPHNALVDRLARAEAEKARAERH
ncbi:ribonuclease H [uncultured Bosea sp.]|uniref:ribonuclease H family protein n=1 Tax=uncultured Bosea sp. TaxID=211457 RepID=UPI00263B2FFA|nr:ribonuclease H [uncultured Bosea sp.]